MSKTDSSIENQGFADIVLDGKEPGQWCPNMNDACLGPACGQWIPNSAACAQVVLAESLYRISRRGLSEIRDVTMQSLPEKAKRQ